MKLPAIQPKPAAVTQWIFLRGLVRESGHWGAFVPFFESQVPGARVHALDLPGNGALYTHTSPTDLKAMVESCRQQLRSAGLAPPYTVLALSMGAMVAVQWAHDYPQELQRQVLVNTSMRPYSAFYERLRPRNWATVAGLVLRTLLRRATGQQWEAAVLRMTTTGHHPQVLQAWLLLRMAHPVSTANALRQLWAAARFRAPARRPSVPTLLLASSCDGLVSVRCSRVLAHVWQVPLVEHPHAGHDLPLDDPQWLVQQICQSAVTVGSHRAASLGP